MAVTCLQSRAPGSSVELAQILTTARTASGSVEPIDIHFTVSKSLGVYQLTRANLAVVVRKLTRVLDLEILLLKNGVVW